MVVLSVVGSFNGLACTLKLIKVKGKGIRFFLPVLITGLLRRFSQLAVIHQNGTA